MTLAFRLDGGGSIVHLPDGALSAGPGVLLVEGCDEGNVHVVASLLRSYVKSPAHINCTDEVQAIHWCDVLAAMSGGPHAIATVRE
jgi:hypothetical protein